MTGSYSSGTRYVERICANSKSGGNVQLALTPKCDGSRALRRCTVYYTATQFSVVELCKECAGVLTRDCAKNHLRLTDESVFRSQLSREQIKSYSHSKFFYKGTRGAYIGALAGLVINSQEFGCLVEVEAPEGQIVRYREGSPLVECPDRAQLRSLINDLLRN